MVHDFSSLYRLEIEIHMKYLLNYMSQNEKGEVYLYKKEEVERNRERFLPSSLSRKRDKGMDHASPACQKIYHRISC